MMMMFVMSVDPVTRIISRSGVIGGPVVGIAAVIAVRIISRITGISVVAVSIRGVTPPNAYSSNSD
jgi:hypothetical protein